MSLNILCSKKGRSKNKSGPVAAAYSYSRAARVPCGCGIGMGAVSTLLTRFVYFWWYLKLQVTVVSILERHNDMWAEISIVL